MLMKPSQLNVDEAIPIYLENNLKKWISENNEHWYLKDQHIWKKKQVNTTQWRTIYEVIEEAYIEESDIFPDNSIK